MTDPQALRVLTGVAQPWQCDVLGHLTTRFYVGLFDDASYHFLFELFGWSGASDDAGRRAFVDVRHVIDYQAEVSAGDLLEIDAKLTRIGSKSMVAQYTMRDRKSGDVSATLEATYVLFDLESRT
ncbi:MAG: acyl-CoA thioesterase, partial [Pseudomonadota bacterium]